MGQGTKTRRSGGWVIDDPSGIRVHAYEMVLPGEPELRLQLEHVAAALWAWTDERRRAHGWRLDTARLRFGLRRSPVGYLAGIWLLPISPSGFQGPRRPRVEKAYVRAIADVRGLDGFRSLLADPHPDLRRMGLRIASLL